MLNFRDPSIAFRALIVALSGISVVLLVAGTALDEYVASDGLGALGCQKLADTSVGFAYRAPFKYMRILSLVIIIATSVLCLLLAIATALNALVLLKGTHQKPALVLTSLVTLLLLAVIVAANINFTVTNSLNQYDVISKSEEYKTAHGEYMLGYTVKQAEKEINKWGNEIDRQLNRDFSDLSKWTRKKRAMSPDGRMPIHWSHSYALLAAAYAFALINIILLIAIQQMAKSGVSTFGALKDKIVASVTDKTWLARVGITLLNLALLVLMVTGTAIDRYCDRKYSGRCELGTRLYDCHAVGREATNRTFKDMLTLAFVLLIVTCVVCLLQAIATLLCIVQLKKDKVLTKPLIGLSAVSTLLLLASVVLACVNFTQKRYFPTEPGIEIVYKHSFTSLCVSFAFSIVNTALNVLNMMLSKRGPSGPSQSRMGSSAVPSSSGMPSQPSSAQPSSK